MPKKKFSRKFETSKNDSKLFEFIHDVGNSLTVLKGNCQLLLLENVLDVKLKKRLKSMESEIKNLEAKIKKYV